jgi:hypothetical protein
LKTSFSPVVSILGGHVIYRSHHCQQVFVIGRSAGMIRQRTLVSYRSLLDPILPKATLIDDIADLPLPSSPAFSKKYAVAYKKHIT